MPCQSSNSSTTDTCLAFQIVWPTVDPAVSGAGYSTDLRRLRIPSSRLEGLQPAEQILLLPRSVTRGRPVCQLHGCIGIAERCDCNMHHAGVTQLSSCATICDRRCHIVSWVQPSTQQSLWLQSLCQLLSGRSLQTRVQLDCSESLSMQWVWLHSVNG